ncbi:MAG: SPFH domain-containing protein [Anaerolineae bacterium]|nr:SPFH domain-containing protein [Anaerolineae bacterium]
MTLSLSLSSLFIIVVIAAVIYRRKQTAVVAEDSMAVTVNRDGFVKRVLPAGRHLLRPYERIDFTVETKTKLVANRAGSITTSDGIVIHINWSGTYAIEPALIPAAANHSQKLRGLPNAEKAIARQVDIHLRKLVGSQTVSDLFNPGTRDRFERQLSLILADKMKVMGIIFNGINLQVIELPHEVAEALNKAKAIATLDQTIRQIDPTTRDVVRGAYQLDEILHWDQYLPVPSRRTMKRLEETTANRI